MPEAFSQGFVLGAGLILAIGAQNLYVLRQGLRRQHVFPVALACAAIDALLIVAGVAGAGTMIAKSPLLTQLAAWGGAIFLLVYGALALKSALKRDVAALELGGTADGSLRRALAAVAAFSLLNPHVYLDTVVILGGIGAQYPPDDRTGFAAGATTASFVWFFALGYGARLLAPLLATPRAQRGLDAFVWIVMWSIAGGLIWNELFRT